MWVGASGRGGERGRFLLLYFCEGFRHGHLFVNGSRFFVAQMLRLFLVEIDFWVLESGL